MKALGHFAPPLTPPRYPEHVPFWQKSAREWRTECEPLFQPICSAIKRGQPKLTPYVQSRISQEIHKLRTFRQIAYSVAAFFLPPLFLLNCGSFATYFSGPFSKAAGQCGQQK